MLTEKQLDDAKSDLKTRYYQLREEVRLELLNSDNQNFIEYAGRVHDLEDQSVADLLSDLQFMNIDRHIQEIRDIDAALLRVAEGNYGTCIDCGTAVAVERLIAYPTAKRCLQCQTLYEKTHVQAGHPSL